MKPELTKGNEAIVKAAVLAGCRAYYGYPITPASEIAEAAALYLPQKSSDADAIVKADAPKRLVMQFVRGVSKSQIQDAFTESFNDNAPAAKRTIGVDLERFLAALEPVKEGDQMIFTYIPDAGTTFAINAQQKLTIAGLDFSQALFSVWLGPKPPTNALKKGLLGQ